MTQHTEPELVSIAYHEAGHALAAVAAFRSIHLLLRAISQGRRPAAILRSNVSCGDDGGEPGAQLRDQFSSKPVVLIGGNECA